MDDELGGKNNNWIRRIKSKNLQLHDGNEDKIAKDTKKYVLKRKLKFEDYKNYFEATQLENKINHLEKNKIDVDSLKED